MSQIFNKLHGFHLTLFGPFAALCAMLVVVLRPSTALYQPLIFLAALGLILCWTLGRGGLFAILGCLNSFVLYRLIAFPEKESLWLLGIALSFGLALATTAFACEEQKNEKTEKNQENENLRFNTRLLEGKVASLEHQVSEDAAYLLNANRELENAVNEASQTKEKLKNCSDQLHKEKKNHDYARALISEQQKGMKDLNLQIDSLSRGKKSMEDEAAKWQQEAERSQKVEKQLLEQHQNKLAQQQGEVQRLANENQKLVEELLHAKQRMNEIAKQLQIVSGEKDDLTKEHQAFIEKLEKQREGRRLEAMYEQLKQQFQEKAMLLDRTRKELFHTQEKFLALQRDWEEAQLHRDDHSAFESHLTKLDNEYAAMAKQYVCEVNALQDLITTLINRK